MGRRLWGSQDCLDFPSSSSPFFLFFLYTIVDKTLLSLEPSPELQHCKALSSLAESHHRKLLALIFAYMSFILWNVRSRFLVNNYFSSSRCSLPSHPFENDHHFDELLFLLSNLLETYLEPTTIQQGEGRGLTKIIPRLLCKSFQSYRFWRCNHSSRFTTSITHSDDDRLR